MFNSAFAIDENNKKNNKSKFDKNTLFRNDNQSVLLCICDVKHYFSKCFYF